MVPAKLTDKILEALLSPASCSLDRPQNENYDGHVIFADLFDVTNLKPT